MAIVEVTHRWDDQHGPCYDCGDPAAFVAPDLYRRHDGSTDNKPVDEANKFCAVCAAQHACDGERIFRLFVEADERITQEHDRYLRELGVKGVREVV